MMTINELIERLDEYRSMLGGDAEVHGICSQDEIVGDDQDDEDEDDEEDEDASVVYLVEGTQLGYGRKQAWNVCGQLIQL